VPSKGKKNESTRKSENSNASKERKVQNSLTLNAEHVNRSERLIKNRNSDPKPKKMWDVSLLKKKKRGGEIPGKNVGSPSASASTREFTLILESIGVYFLGGAPNAALASRNLSQLLCKNDKGAMVIVSVQTNDPNQPPRRRLMKHRASLQVPKREGRGRSN